MYTTKSTQNSIQRSIVYPLATLPPSPTHIRIHVAYPSPASFVVAILVLLFDGQKVDKWHGFELLLRNLEQRQLAFPSVVIVERQPQRW